MNRFTVSSGTFRAVLMADDAYEAAAEAIRCWGEPAVRPLLDGPLSTRLAPDDDALGDEIRVCSRRPGIEIHRYSTVSVLAHVHQMTTEAAWERILRRCFSRN